MGGARIGAAHPRLLRVLLVVAALLLAGCASSGPAVASPSRPAPVGCTHCWHPALRTSWDWVLSHVPRPPLRHVQMYDVDGLNASAGTVAALHAARTRAVCYLDAGSYEDWRADAARFSRALLGKGNGWPGERWLDIRDLQRPHSRLRAVLDHRLDLCRAKHFDMVELDNLDGYQNDTGFPLTAADQLFFNATLANDSHRRGMSVLLKNDLEQIPQLLGYFDGALDEQCNQYAECTTAQNGGFGLDQFVRAGKPVFQAEYTLPTARFCRADNAADFNGLRLALNLDDSVFQPCR